jgi:outer membrane protein OmpA-like peptidoglycan-associated protein
VAKNNSTTDDEPESPLKIEYSYYKGILRCQFTTSGTQHIGKEHRSIFSHLSLQPKYEFYETQEVTQQEYTEWLSSYIDRPHLRSTEKEIIEYYNHTDATDGKRMYADGILMGVEQQPKVVDQKLLDWSELRLESVPEKYLHDCFIAYTPNTNHGRISGPAMLRRVKQVDEKGVEIFNSVKTENSRDAILERQGCFQNSRGCAHRIYRFNLGLKNWINSLFGGIFGSNFIGNEPNGCMPSLFPSGCTGQGCQRFGCGIFGLLASLTLLLWLFRTLLFGENENTNENREKSGQRVVERIVHDTIYIEKNSRVDTVTYVDETTNTTVKMLNLPSVQFEKGKAKLLRSSIPQLNELAAYLLENNGVEAEIIGHTDSDGDAEKNRMLSQRRAEAVRHYLMQNGVDGKRIKATGKGESEPVTENETAEGRAMNRRVEVKLSQYNTSKTVRTEKERKRD